MMEDLTASDTAGWYSVISLHGGGSPEAMRRELYRYYPIEERRALVERLLERGLVDRSNEPSDVVQPGKCCPVGCQVPETPVLAGPAEKPIRMEKSRLRAIENSASSNGRRKISN